MLKNEQVWHVVTYFPWNYANFTIFFSGFFKSYFIAVEEESRIDHSDLSEHERQLLIDYKTKESTAGDEYEDHEKGSKKQNKNSNDAQDGYEKVKPKHGDVGFYKFVSAINKNPGHILRYIQTWAA